MTHRWSPAGGRQLPRGAGLGRLRTQSEPAFWLARGSSAPRSVGAGWRRWRTRCCPSTSSSSTRPHRYAAVCFQQRCFLFLSLLFIVFRSSFDSWPCAHQSRANSGTRSYLLDLCQVEASVGVTQWAATTSSPGETWPISLVFGKRQCIACDLRFVFWQEIGLLFSSRE
jgi:hypothetical protein